MRRVNQAKFLLQAAVAAALVVGPYCAFGQDAAPQTPPPGIGAPSGTPPVAGAPVAPGAPVVISASPTTQPATVPSPTLTLTPTPGPANVEIRIPSTKPATTQFSFNFKDAPIDTVINYISSETGYTVIKLAPLDGRVTVVSQQPVSAEDAVSLLNTVLSVNGFAALQEGKTLKIMSRDKIKKANIPVEWGADASKIVPNDNVITQVIPIKTVDAAKLKQDLATLVSPDADFTANAASNVLVITDSQANVRRVVQIVQALDRRDPADSGILTKQLKFSDAAAMVKLIQDIFKPDQEQQSNSNLPPQVQFFRSMMRSRGGGGGGFSGGGGGGGTGAAGDENSTGGEREAKVYASSEDRTNTIVVTGPQATLDMIDKEILTKIDANPASEQTFFIYPLKNAQAQNLQSVLNSLFGVSGSSGSRGGSSTNGFGSAASTSSRSYGSNGLSGGSSSGGGFGGGASGGGSGSGGFSSSGSSAISRASGTFARGTPTGLGGISGGLPSGVSGAAAQLMGQVYVVADPDTNSLLVATATKFENQVREIIDQLDRPVAQVLIKVLIAEVTHENTSDLGFDFSILNQRAATSTVNGVATPRGVVGTQTFVDNATEAGGLTVSLVEKNIQATLQALATQNKLDVLSRPYILATDNQLAEITVGSEVPLITDSRQTDTGETINNFNYRDVGIILDVTPHINPDGLVIMDVSPEISALSTSTVETSPGVNTPIIDLRSANSRVGVKDGNTVVIGGLMQDEKNSVLQKIPFLGDIPVLGVLFQNNHVDRTKTELLIFITPHVAAQADMLRPMSQDEIRGLKLTPGAVEPGAFDDHIRGLQRGEAPGGGVLVPRYQPTAPGPTTAPAAVPGAPSKAPQ
jgi:general secretion pathway protein D